MTRSNNSRKGKRGGKRKMSPTPKKIGNSYKINCSFCSPQLSIRLDNKKAIIQENNIYNNQIKNINSLTNYLNYL
jgi:hypothetical protein